MKRAGKRNHWFQYQMGKTTLEDILGPLQTMRSELMGREMIGSRKSHISSGKHGDTAAAPRVRRCFARQFVRKPGIP